MKRTIFTIVLAVLMSCSVFANDDQKYYKVMGEAIGEMFGADSNEGIKAAINKFERVSMVEKDKWEPAYYAAFGYLKLYENAKTSAEKDQYIDQAIQKVKEGLKLAENEDELHAMKGYVYMMKMVIDPMSRAPEYSPVIIGAYQKALAIDGKNPRAWYLLGQMQLGTASFMGGSTEEGCTSIKNAVENFEDEKPATPIAPSWGKEAATQAATKCQ